MIHLAINNLFFLVLVFLSICCLCEHMAHMYMSIALDVRLVGWLIWSVMMVMMMVFQWWWWWSCVVYICMFQMTRSLAIRVCVCVCLSVWKHFFFGPNQSTNRATTGVFIFVPILFKNCVSSKREIEKKSSINWPLDRFFYFNFWSVFLFCLEFKYMCM